MPDNAVTSFTSHASRYDAERRRLVPPFDDFYRAAIEALELSVAAQRRVLDIGAGTGLLSEHIADALPDAELLLLDGSREMLDLAEQRLGARAASYVVGDLRDPLPPGPFTAVVSSLAIHHLGDDDKRDLFRRVHGALEPGGVFVDADQVLAPGELLAAGDFCWHRDSARRLGSDEDEWARAVERMRHDRLSPLEDQLRWLREAGFAEVDCLYKRRCFAVIVAIR